MEWSESDQQAIDQLYERLLQQYRNRIYNPIPYPYSPSGDLIYNPIPDSIRKSNA